jgi:hypothetical protein
VPEPQTSSSEENKIVFRPTRRVSRFKPNPARKIRAELNKLSANNRDKILDSIRGQFTFKSQDEITGFIQAIAVK